MDVVPVGAARPWTCSPGFDGGGWSSSRRLAVVIAVLVVAAVLVTTVGADPSPAASGATGTAAICDDAATLVGPSSPPAGSVRVEPDQSLMALTQEQPAGTTFWLAPGVHILGPDRFDQVVPKTGDTYIGGPGAVVDGRGINQSAFGWYGTDVTVKHLTIRGFIPGLNQGVVNHEHADRWTVEANTIQDNSGAGVVVGDGNVVRFNCLRHNGQYGFNVFEADVFTLSGNEIAGNNVADWEVLNPGCGCSGGGKFWASNRATVTDNWVHDNRGVGLWVDTDNYDFRIENNLIENNDAEAIFYELSYNGRIANNTMRRNALVRGRQFASQGLAFPVGAIYVAESGGDARVGDGAYATFDITGNVLEDNWGGVVLAEDANRFCGSPSGATNFCTRGGSASFDTCVPGTISTAPYVSDCRWKTKNVAVFDNDFRLSKAAIACNGLQCGLQGLIANSGTYPWWSPYLGPTIQNAVTFSQNNRFYLNRYTGDWKAVAFEQSDVLDPGTWQAAPYGQDIGSTFSAGPVTPGAAVLDADTTGLETTIGQWEPWFSSDMSRSTAAAHGGGHSLRIDVTAVYGWGVQQRGGGTFPAAPGAKTIGFWGLAPGESGDGSLVATLRVHWQNAAGELLQADSVSLPLSSGWAPATAEVVAPAGTAKVNVDLSDVSGGPGDTMYIDDIVVKESTSPPSSTSSTTATTAAPTTTTSVPPPTTTTAALTTTTTTVLATTTTTAAPTTSTAAALTTTTGAPATTTTTSVPASTTTAPSTTSTTVPATTTTTGAPTTTTTAPSTTVAPTTTVASTTTTTLAAGSNALDTDTSTIEGSTGHWVPWFSSSISRTTAQAHGGTHSLQVDVTQQWGWGVTLDNWPGFIATPGNKTIGFWARSPGAGLSVTMQVTWRNAAGTVLQTDVVTRTLTNSWQQGTANLTAPAGTARVLVDFSNTSGGPGATVYLDDVVVAGP